MVIPYGPGGATDSAARLVAASLQARLGQPVIVENRLGANGAIASQYVMTSPPDGYTLLMGNADVPMLSPMQNFSPVGLVAKSSIVLVISSSFDVSSIEQLVTQARSNPGKFSIGVGPGTISDRALELFQSAADLKFQAVPYNGVDPVLMDVLAGRLLGAFLPITAVTSQLPTGRLKALAVASEKRSGLLPNVPTFAELNFRNVVAEQWFALFAPARTPAQTTALLNEAVRRALSEPGIKEKLSHFAEAAVSGSVNDFVSSINQSGGGKTCETNCPKNCKDTCKKEGDKQCCITAYPPPP